MQALLSAFSAESTEQCQACVRSCDGFALYPHSYFVVCGSRRDCHQRKQRSTMFQSRGKPPTWTCTVAWLIAAANTEDSSCKLVAHRSSSLLYVSSTRPSYAWSCALQVCPPNATLLAALSAIHACFTGAGEMWVLGFCQGLSSYGAFVRLCICLALPMYIGLLTLFPQRSSAFQQAVAAASYDWNPSTWWQEREHSISVGSYPTENNGGQPTYNQLHSRATSAKSKVTKR